MSIQDLINGLFELFGGVFILLHCRRLWIDKQVKGASAVATTFMTSWGIWNLYYYPHLGQWLSFFGGLMIVIANMVWITLMVYYIRHPGGRYYDSARSQLRSPPAPRPRSALTFD